MRKQRAKLGLRHCKAHMAKDYRERMARRINGPDKRRTGLDFPRRLEQGLRKTANPDFYDDMGYMEI